MKKRKNKFGLVPFKEYLGDIKLKEILHAWWGVYSVYFPTEYRLGYYCLVLKDCQNKNIQYDVYEMDLSSKGKV